MNNEAPRILTLQLEESAFTYFNNLRKQYFPPKINYLDAHITLFHHLPASAVITELLESVTAKQLRITLEVPGLLKLGRGVAFQLQSKELMQLQSFLKQKWQDLLIPQDRQGFRPHITIQNKVNPAEAQALFEELNLSFEPFKITGIGLSLWEYLGGPWQKVKDYSFSDSLSD